MNEELIAKGFRILMWQLVISLGVSLVGSAAFLSGFFDDFPFAWF